MIIGIIIHSKSGNTLSIAREIEGILQEKHTVELIELKESFPIEVPNISSYDSLIFGSSVESLAIEAHMKRVMKKLPSLKGKKVFNFTNQFFPFSFLGGMQARNTMRRVVSKKGAHLLGETIIHWLPAKKKRSDMESLKTMIREIFQPHR